MKWRFEPPERRRDLARNRIANWHVWFAWYPVRIGEELVWLEPVWRRITRHLDYDGYYAVCQYTQVPPTNE